MEKDEIVRFIAEWQNRILRIQGIDREYLHALQETIGSRPTRFLFRIFFISILRIFVLPGLIRLRGLMFFTGHFELKWRMKRKNY
jgi:hypothetical protein